MAKTLIIYYSRAGENYVNGQIISLPVGQTAKAVTYLEEATGADVFPLEPLRAYSKDYTTCTQEALAEEKDQARPGLMKMLTDVAAYERIIVAGPCWWGTFPMFVFTQLEALDLSGKDVYVLMTHEGSGLGHVMRDLQQSCPGASVVDGLAVHGADVEQEKGRIQAWGKEISDS